MKVEVSGSWFLRAGEVPNVVLPHNLQCCKLTLIDLTEENNPRKSSGKALVVEFSKEILIYTRVWVIWNGGVKEEDPLQL
jgi:hypothetical protein